MISLTPPEKILEIVVKRMLKPRLYYLKKYIELHYGKRCKKDMPGCGVCDAWASYDELKRWLNENNTKKQAETMADKIKELLNET